MMGIPKRSTSIDPGVTKWYWEANNSSAASVTRLVLKAMLYGTKIAPNPPTVTAEACQNLSHSRTLVFS